MKSGAKPGCGLNPRTGALTHVVAKRKNSGLFVALVEALRARYRRSTVLHLILDNCIIHKSRQLLRHLARLAGRVVLHFLPPYSPEANVIEEHPTDYIWSAPQAQQRARHLSLT